MFFVIALFIHCPKRYEQFPGNTGNAEGNSSDGKKQFLLFFPQNTGNRFLLLMEILKKKNLWIIRLMLKGIVSLSVAEPEPQEAASFGRSRSRSCNAMRLRL
jgi:hypothetical protein